MIFDTHAHYNLDCFDANREALFQQMKDTGIDKVICPSIGFAENAQMLHKLESYGWITFAVGIHPSRTPLLDWDDEFIEAELRRMASHPRVVAIGELGLDYHSGLENHPHFIEREMLWFHRQLSIATEAKLPLVLHIRSSAERPGRANEDAIRILQDDSQPHSGVVHCYNSDYETACRFLDIGDYVFGIGGCLTYENMDALRQAVIKLPLDRLVLETDAPFLVPTGCSGKRNTSLNLPTVIQLIADLKKVSVETVEQVTYKTAIQMFPMRKCMEDLG